MRINIEYLASSLVFLPLENLSANGNFLYEQKGDIVHGKKYKSEGLVIFQKLGCSKIMS